MDIKSLLNTTKTGKFVVSTLPLVQKFRGYALIVTLLMICMLCLYDVLPYVLYPFQACEVFQCGDCDWEMTRDPRVLDSAVQRYDGTAVIVMCSYLFMASHEQDASGWKDLRVDPVVCCTWRAIHVMECRLDVSDSISGYGMDCAGHGPCVPGTMSGGLDSDILCMMSHMPNMLCTIHFEAFMMRHQTMIGSYMTNTDCLVVQPDRDTPDYLCYVVKVQLHNRYIGEPSKDDSHLRLCLIEPGSRVCMTQLYIFDYGCIYCYDVDQILTEVVYSMSADMCVVYLDDYGCIYFSDVDQIVNEGVYSMIMRMLIVVNLNHHDELQGIIHEGVYSMIMRMLIVVNLNHHDELQGIIHHNLVDMFSVCTSD